METKDLKYVKTAIYGGRSRRLYEAFCGNCKVLVPTPKNRLMYFKNIFCSKECKNTLQTKKIAVPCFYCGSEVQRTQTRINRTKNKVVFCNRKCKEAAAKDLDNKFDIIRPEWYNKGITTYRDKALRHLDRKCVCCGYDKDKRMLDVDHKDGNRKNGELENLQFLCVWCHALKTRTGLVV